MGANLDSALVRAMALVFARFSLFEFSMSHPVFDDAAVQRILGQASADGPTDGLTLPELLAVAEEAGLDVESVRRAAAAELGGIALRGSTAMVAVGRKTVGSQVAYNALLPRRLSKGEVEIVIERVRDAFSHVGIVSRSAQRVSWQTSGRGSRYVHVAVTTNPSTTDIQVEESLSARRLVLYAIYGGGGALVGITGALAAYTLAGAIAGIAWAGLAVSSGLYWGARRFALLRNEREETINKLLARISQDFGAGD